MDPTTPAGEHLLVYLLTRGRTIRFECLRCHERFEARLAPGFVYPTTIAWPEICERVDFEVSKTCCVVWHMDDLECAAGATANNTANTAVKVRVALPLS